MKWLLRRPDGAEKAVVAADVAAVVSKVYNGRAALDALGLDPETDLGGALELERITGYTAILSACLSAKLCLQDWNMVDPRSGVPLDFTDPETLRAALVHGAPPFGQPLLAPFVAWLEGPRRPVAVEMMRLQRLAKDHWSGGAERCAACADVDDGCSKGAPQDGQVCPRLELAPITPEGMIAWSIASTTSGLWQRAGMGAALIGLDYRGALLAFESEIGEAKEPLDFGAAFSVFRAIEAGRMEAEALKAEAGKAE